jgi:MerR family transcriptional regulator, light-induced transcriptional regulator
MRDSQHEGQMERDGGSVSLLAVEVVARLIGREAKAERKPNAAVLAKLTKAMLNPDPAAFAALRPDLRRGRISNADLADLYFPSVARKLGCDWEADSVSFAGLSIAVARMQAILRQIGAAWVGDDGAGSRIGTLLLILPEGEQHTLGAMVLAGQLRRKGVSVSLTIAPEPSVLRRLLAERSFDGAMVSVGCSAKVAPCRAVVKALKAGSGGRLPVAVGGAVLLRETDIAARTGADIATNDLTEALAALGLTVLPEALELEFG